MLSGNTRAQCDPASCDFDAPTLDASCNACMLTLLNTSTSSGSSVADLRRVAHKTDARAMATWGTFTVCSNVAAWHIATAQRANPSAAVALVSEVAMLGFPLSDGSSCEGGCREFHRPVLPATCQSIQKKTVFRYGLSLFLLHYARLCESRSMCRGRCARRGAAWRLTAPMPRQCCATSARLPVGSRDRSVQKHVAAPTSPATNCISIPTRAVHRPAPRFAAGSSRSGLAQTYQQGIHSLQPSPRKRPSFGGQTPSVVTSPTKRENSTLAHLRALPKAVAQPSIRWRALRQRCSDRCDGLGMVTNSAIQAKL